MSLSLAASKILKAYHGRPVLQDVSFSFEEKGVYVLTGPNGSGKSTLLRICSLIEEPDAGEVIYTSEGRALPKDMRLRRRITLVLPQIGIFNTTVYKNTAYGLRIRGMLQTETAQRVDDALAFVGLAHKRDQNALRISSGEKQRLGIARALVVEPEILFFDEPTASIDAKNCAVVEEIILNLKAGRKTIIIMTTHDESQAKRLADYQLTMNEGRLGLR